MEAFKHRTLILIDCHPDSHTVCLTGPEDFANCTLWSCFVEATLEYCRIVFDTLEGKRNDPLVSVHVAGLPAGRNVLNSWDQQNLNQIAQNFSYISPQAVAPSPMRIPLALENAIESIEFDQVRNPKIARFVLLLMGKGIDDREFNYHETREETVAKDLRQMILAAWTHNSQHNTNTLEHCHFDILRVIPPHGTIPDDMPWTELSSKISATVYNISSHRENLTCAMIHLSQMHRRLNSLHLVGVPMKKTSQNTKMTYEIDLLYPLWPHNPSLKKPNKNVAQTMKRRIYEKGYLDKRQTVVRWSKKGHELDTLVTRCAHTLTPLDITHSPTSVLVHSLLNGSIQLFTTLSSSTISSSSDSPNPITIDNYLTHMISCRDGILYLHCLSHSKEGNIFKPDLLNMPLPAEIETFSVLKELPDPYVEDFIKRIAQPNILSGQKQSVESSQTGSENLKPYEVPGNDFREFGIAEIENFDNLNWGASENNIKSSFFLDWETRWWKGFLIKNGDNGMKLLSGVKNQTRAIEILAQFKKLICVEEPEENFEEIVNKSLDNLLQMTRGSDNFESQKDSVMVLKQIRVIGEIFKSVSIKHQEISQIINRRIKPDGTENKQPQTSKLKKSKSKALFNRLESKSSDSETSMVWQQLDSFNNMTHRELKDLSEQAPSPSAGVPSQQQQTNQGNTRFSKPGYHPDYYFHKNRRGTAGGKNSRGPIKPGVPQQQEEQQTLPVNPIPYLDFKPVSAREIALEREEYKRRLGDKGSLFYHYWISQKTEEQSFNSMQKLFSARFPLND
ncbi:hypothetical protein G9A89_008782 [Geosiphon pyriformis]|nr:hypothetical protein G9A89_008782 [Geosiphon pyriformis]